MHCLTRLLAFCAKNKSRDSTSAALKRLESTARHIICHERDTSKLFGSAETLSRMYLELQARHTAMQLMSQTRSEISSRDSSGSPSCYNYDGVDRRCFVFITTIEALFEKRSSAGLFAEVVNDVFIEACLFGAWVRTVHSPATLEVRMAIGSQLIGHLRLKNRMTEAQRIRDEVWQSFKRDLSPESPRSGVMWDLFESCLSEMAEGRTSTNLIESAVFVVTNSCQAGSYQQALDLSRWIHSYVLKSRGFEHQSLRVLGFKLALCLAGISTSDGTLDKAIRDLSSEILSESLKGQKPFDLHCENMTLQQLNVVIRLLGQQKN